MRSAPGGLIALFLLAACAAGSENPDNGAVCNAFNGSRSHVEVVARGKVSRTFGTRMGRSSPHQGFLVDLDSACSLTVQVESNTDFTGSFPLHDGDSVTVKGEYEFYPGGGVIHWTHHDPRGRHPGGFVETGGRIYE
jgi:hypothetical protein